MQRTAYLFIFLSLSFFSLKAQEIVSPNQEVDSTAINAITMANDTIPNDTTIVDTIVIRRYKNA